MFRLDRPPGQPVSADSARDFDTLLCYNDDDKASVMKIGSQLIRIGLRPWLDEWEIRPGAAWLTLLQEQISRIKSATVFVGQSGIGPWQRREIDAVLMEFVERGCPIIPVILPSAETIPNFPIFIRGMKRIDFRKNVPDPLAQLVWGITGTRIEQIKYKRRIKHNE